MSNPPAADAEAESVSEHATALRLSDAPAIANARLEAGDGSPKEAEVAPSVDAAGHGVDAAPEAVDAVTPPQAAPYVQKAGAPTDESDSKQSPDGHANGIADTGVERIAESGSDRNGSAVVHSVGNGTPLVDDAFSEDGPVDAEAHAGANGATHNGAANGYHGPIARLIETSEIGPVSAQQPPINPALSANVSPILNALDEAEWAESAEALVTHDAQAEMDLAAPDAFSPAPSEQVEVEPEGLETPATQDAAASPLEEPTATHGVSAEPLDAEPPQAPAAELEAANAVTEDAAAPPEPESAVPASAQTHASEPGSAPEAEREPLASPSPAMTGAFDAATKLVAEANAAAEALENLKRLLERRMPGLAVSAAPSATRLHSIERKEGEELSAEPPPPLPLYPVRSSDGNLPALRPAQPKFEAPAPYAPEPRRPDVRGFMAGFALSWAIGAALYIYLTAG